MPKDENWLTVDVRRETVDRGLWEPYANLGGRCEETFLTVGIPEGKADIIIGGPPCQPFSQIGYQRGARDARDGFPVFLDAVKRIQPKIAIVENVRGLLFRNKDYLRNAARE